MPQRLKGMVAIITGAGGDLGSAIATRFSAAGAKVVLAGRTQTRLDMVADSIRACGGTALTIATDVTNADEVNHMVDFTVKEFGAVNILVNNAGNALHYKAPDELTPDEWEQGVALNLTSAFLCSRAAGKIMITRKSGRIVNMSSMAGMGDGSALFVHYAAAKAGIVNLTKGLASAWARYGIGVNCIAPGAIATQQVVDLGFMPPETFEDGTKRGHLQMPPPPSAVADLALFLASQESAHISGETIPIRLVS